MRIAVVSRIFVPEPSAASLILQATVKAFSERGHEVVVYTASPPKALPAGEDPPGVRVRRARVKRDAQGYVRGYLSYMSFDIPVFFRLLFSRRADVYLVEPPPTTGAVVRGIAMLKRAPYVYDAADLWSDAAAMVTSNRLVLRVLRGIERFAMRGASRAFAVSDELVSRMRALGISVPVTVVGFGAETGEFRHLDTEPSVAPLLVYGGSYSEWHGAGVFVDAFEEVRRQHPDARLLFVGNGQERPVLEEAAAQRGVGGVEFRDPVSPGELAILLNQATVSLASLRPGYGYDYAFTTKIYSSLASGCPVIFSGVGPTIDFLSASAAVQPVGVAVPYDADEVARAMLAAIAAPLSADRRRQMSEWAAESFSLDSVGHRVAAGTVAVAERAERARSV